MTIRQLTVLNELGIHARVVSRIVNEARKYSSSIIVKKEDRSFDLKVMLGVIEIGACKDDVLRVEFDGEDEEQAAIAFEALFLDKFGEK